MHQSEQKTAQAALPGQGGASRARIGADGASWTSPPQGRRGEQVLVPGEHVRLLTVELPLRQARARTRALPYAIEPMIAQSLETQHTALGPRIEGNQFLAAAVGRDRMEAWRAMLDAAGAPHAALLPEACILDVPDDGVWAIRREDGRVIVRKPDGTGFSASDTLFSLVHEAAGRPDLAEVDDGQWAGLTGMQTIDLRQGAYSARQAPELPGLRAAALVLAAGAGLHLAIAGADLVLLGGIADARERTAIELLGQAGLAAGRDPAATILTHLPPAPPARSHLFAMLEQTAGALGTQDSLHVSALRYRGMVPELSIDLQAGDIGGLQAAEQALARAGFDASSGSASAAGGLAEATIILQPGRAP